MSKGITVQKDKRFFSDLEVKEKMLIAFEYRIRQTPLGVDFTKHDTTDIFDLIISASISASFSAIHVGNAYSVSIATTKKYQRTYREFKKIEWFVLELQLAQKKMVLEIVKNGGENIDVERVDKNSIISFFKTKSEVFISLNSMKAFIKRLRVTSNILVFPKESEVRSLKEATEDIEKIKKNTKIILSRMNSVKKRLEKTDELGVDFSQSAIFIKRIKRSSIFYARLQELPTVEVDKIIGILSYIASIDKINVNLQYFIYLCSCKSKRKKLEKTRDIKNRTYDRYRMRKEQRCFFESILFKGFSDLKVHKYLKRLFLENISSRHNILMLSKYIKVDDYIKKLKIGEEIIFPKSNLPIIENLMDETLAFSKMQISFSKGLYECVRDFKKRKNQYKKQL